MTGISQHQPDIRASRSSPPAETTAFPGTRRRLRTCSRLAGLRSRSQAREATDPRPPGTGAAAGTARTSRSQLQSAVQTTGRRSTPDVSFDADSSTGVNIYETSPRSGQGSWRTYGGTSLGAPVWAGIIAIVDQGRAFAGKGNLDGATQTIPSLYALPESDFKTVCRPMGWHRRLFDTARRSIRLELERGDREYCNGPRITERAVADRRPGDDHDDDEAVLDERYRPDRKRLSLHRSPSQRSMPKPGHAPRDPQTSPEKPAAGGAHRDSREGLPHQAALRNSNHEVRMSFTVSARPGRPECRSLRLTQWSPRGLL